MIPRPLKNAINTTFRVAGYFGVDGFKAVRTLVGLPGFARDAKAYAKYQNKQFPFHWKYAYPVLDERYINAGAVDGHYFHQDLWAAREIFRANPVRHVDIGSRIDGFIAHLLVFREVEVVDIRPLMPNVSGLRFTQDDATELKRFADDSLESISSLHAAEHFGLGRYGDAIDPDAWSKFAHALTRVLRPGGHLYFSVPCGREKLHFNAHRVFSPDTLIDAFCGLNLVSLHGVADDGHLYEHMPAKALAGQQYGCGLFHFTK